MSAVPTRPRFLGMNDLSSLAQLTARLSDSLAKLPADFRARHGDFLQRSQRPDGGFPDREGGSDLYYTAFGLRGLAVLDALTPAICDRAAVFLRSALKQQASV